MLGGPPAWLCPPLLLGPLEAAPCQLQQSHPLLPPGDTEQEVMLTTKATVGGLGPSKRYATHVFALTGSEPVLLARRAFVSEFMSTRTPACPASCSDTHLGPRRARCVWEGLCFLGL